MGDKVSMQTAGALAVRVITAEEASHSRQLNLPNQEHAELLQLRDAPALCPCHDLVLHRGLTPT